MRNAKVGQHWDDKLGDELDVLVPADEERLKAQMLRSLANVFGFDGKSFSRARGRFVPGAKRWPCALRSAEFVLGLPNIKVQADRDKVKVGNLLAEKLASWCTMLDRAGLLWVIENPRNSWLWQLPCMMELQRGKAFVSRRSTTACMVASDGSGPSS